MKTFDSIREKFSSWRNSAPARREAKAIATLAVNHPHSISTRRDRRNVARAVKTLANLGKPHFVRNWYESGNPFSDGTRSTVGNYSTDARYDQNPVTRRTMEIRCRYWEQNSTLMKRGLDVSSQYVIGTHMPVVTSLADRGENSNWQANAETVFTEMCESAGLNGESMFALLDVAHRRKKVDGNALLIETNKPGSVVIRRGTKHETKLQVQRPCYQIIESQRIGTSYGPWMDPVENVVDGVQYEEIETRLANGKVRKQRIKSGYWINDAISLQSGSNYLPVFVPIEFCYYATTAHRVDEPRGVSDFYAAEPTLALLEDLLEIEMRAQEVQSDIATFITNGAGQLPDPKMTRTLQGVGIKVSADAQGRPVVTADDVKKATEIYQKIWGGKQFVGRTGDTLQMMAPTRPAEATLNLWNFLIDSFCAASNWPRILIFPRSSKGQGTEVRAEIEAANAAFIKEFNLVWKPFIHRAWKYFIGWAIKNDERLKNAPANWEHIEVSPPRSVVVDLGYVSANNLSEMAAGVYPLHNWAQDHGTTKQKLIQHSVRDLFDIKLACQKMAENPEYKGITVDAAEVRQNLSEVVKNLAAMKTAEAQKAKIETEDPEEVAA